DLRRPAMPVDWHGRTLVPMYHPGRQSTLHRPHAQQVGDWRRLGALLRERQILPALPNRYAARAT
ncbi:MAG TPA: hypothetical protein VNM91_07135, partial [Dehalococcoidia bacterium]|nr:hypothetical protein [Dehalococcoidia bacterium]